MTTSANLKKKKKEKRKEGRKKTLPHPKSLQRDESWRTASYMGQTTGLAMPKPEDFHRTDNTTLFWPLPRWCERLRDGPPNRPFQPFCFHCKPQVPFCELAHGDCNLRTAQSSSSWLTLVYRVTVDSRHFWSGNGVLRFS